MKILVTTAIYPTADNPAFGAFVRSQVDALEGAGVDVEVFVLSGRNRKTMYAKAVPELRRRLARGDVDLVHAHYSYVGAVARLQRRAPVVLTYHGDDLQGTRDASGRLTARSRVIAAGGQLLAGVVDAAIVQNRLMAHRARFARRVYVIPHEVDLDLYRPVERDTARAALGLDPARRYLLFAASPDVPVKNFPLARATAEALAADDPAVELIVACREPQERLALLMNACDALVFPSFQEGSPVVVKQAMGCNLPIVATDVGDVRDLIGRCAGCHVVPGDLAAFVAATRSVLATRARTAGRAHVSHLAAPRVAARLISVYEDVLAGAAPRPVPAAG